MANAFPGRRLHEPRGPSRPGRFYRDFVGRVFLRGGLNHGSGIGSNTTIFTLDEGFQPVYKHTFFVAADAASGDTPQRVTVNTDATVVANQAGAEAGRLFLDVVQFRTT